MILSLHEFLYRQIPYLFYYRKTLGTCHRISSCCSYKLLAELEQ